jgi:hypothetical protein
VCYRSIDRSIKPIYSPHPDLRISLNLGYLPFSLKIPVCSDRLAAGHTTTLAAILPQHSTPKSSFVSSSGIPRGTQQKYFVITFVTIMGAASKTCSVILRSGELISATIIAGILGRYLYFLSSANAHVGSRVIYAEVIAGISILASLVLFPPLKYSFYCFGLDFALCICWTVAFALLCNVSYSIVVVKREFYLFYS